MLADCRWFLKYVAPAPVAGGYTAGAAGVLAVRTSVIINIGTATSHPPWVKTLGPPIIG
jgi:hypothetical protein